MPISPKRSPFHAAATGPVPVKLRTPQARVLAVLMPESVDDPWFDWPFVTHGQIKKLAGYSSLSGTVTRALNGTPQGSGNGVHIGLIQLGFVVEEILYVEDVKEINYRATPDGFRAYQAYIAENGRLPEMREKVTYTNTKRRKKNSENSEKIDLTGDEGDGSIDSVNETLTQAEKESGQQNLQNPDLQERPEGLRFD